ncbi:MAG: hypothetical protein KDB53_17435 [Planctomycetes bacterium]|nr:hypothetical protein [Planctomycetota bacterium]
MSPRLSLALPFVVLGVFTILAQAQQLDVNSPGGSLQSNGTDPVPGTPFAPNLNSSIQLTIAGGASRPIALVVGQLALVSTPIPFTTQFFDLNQVGAALVVNGFGGGGVLPFPLGFLNTSGTASYSFALNAATAGQHFAFQGIVGDPTAPPINLSLTAAAEFVPTAKITVVGDDVLTNFFVPSGPVLFKGQNYSAIQVSTNGWIKFGLNATNNDLSELYADMVSGLIGAGTAAPAIAVLWDDLDVGNTPLQNQIIDEAIPGIITVTWNNADYFPSTPLGTFSCTIDSVAFGPGLPLITLDYTAANMAGRAEGIVGITAGGGSAVTVEHNLVVGGVVNPYVFSNPTETLFQSFATGVGVAPEPVDLSAKILSFADLTGTNGWSLF